MEITTQYDVALSFAGEDRQYVREVADQLRSVGISVFYDEYEKANLWGKDLYTHLSEIYGRRSRFTVMFISTHYARKLWTNHERRSAQEKAFTERQEYILPVIFDETEVPGILKTVGYIDARNTPPEDLSTLIRQKLENSTAAEEFVSHDQPVGSGASVIWMKELLWPLFERIEQIQNGEVPGISSGIEDLDKITGGWRQQDLVVVAGDQYRARDFVLHCGFYAATIENIRTIVVSFNSSPVSLAQRALAWTSGVPSKVMKSPALTDIDYARLAIAAGSLNTAPLHFLESTWGTGGWVDATRVAIDERSGSLIVIDGLHEIYAENKAAYLQTTLWSIRRLAEELGVSVLVALPEQKSYTGNKSSESETPEEYIDIADKCVTVIDDEYFYSRQPLIRRLRLSLRHSKYEESASVIAGINEVGLIFDGDRDTFPATPLARQRGEDARKIP